MSKSSTAVSSGSSLVCLYGLLLVVNLLTVWLAAQLFPQQIVLGTYSITPGWALIHSMGALTLITTFTVPLVRCYERRRQIRWRARQWLMLYLVINFLAVWGLARFADQLGFGVSSWAVALALAAVLDIVQSAAVWGLRGCRRFCLGGGR